MRDVRVIAALACVFLVTHGCASVAKSRSEKVPEIVVSHHAIGRDVFEELRLVADRDVFVKITDANTLIYSYALESRDIVIDSAARAAVRGILFAPAATAERTQMNAGTSEFTRFANGVFSSLRTLVEFVRYSDEEKSPSLVVNRRNGDMATLAVREDLAGEGQLAARAERLWQALTDDERTALQSTRTLLVAAIPRVVALHKAIERATFGDLWIQRSTTAADASIVELTISSKLAPDYPGVRWTGKGKDIALVRAAFPRLAWTGGMGGVFRSDRAFHVQQLATDSSKYRVIKSSDSRLALVPLGMLTYQMPCCRGPERKRSTLLGVSGGIGLRSGATRQVDEGTDLFLMLTLGLDWLRVSAGGAYTAEVYELTDIQQDSIVTSPNALNSQRTKRRLRPAIAFHMSF